MTVADKERQERAAVAADFLLEVFGGEVTTPDLNAVLAHLQIAVKIVDGEMIAISWEGLRDEYP